MKQHLTRIAAFLLVALPGLSKAQEEEFLKDNDRIVLIGNTFMERAQRFGHLEATILSRSKAKNLVVRNLGWSGDSVFNDSRAYFGKPQEGRNRLQKALGEIKPEVVFICYGAGAATSINQKWTDEKGEITKYRGEGLDADITVFLRGYNLLIDSLHVAAGQQLREIVIVTPPPFENLGKPLPDQILNNQNLAVFTEGIVKMAKERDFRVVDLFNTMGYREEVASEPLTNNGIHYGEKGYERIAQHLASELGLPKAREDGDSSDLRKTINEKNRLFFHQWRPANETYLFLFRKHEQGNNAKEIPMFDPLIKEKEDKIEQLRTQLR